MSAPNFAKKKSTEVSGTKGRGRSTGVQEGQLVAGNDIKAEYDYLQLQMLKAQIKDDKSDADSNMGKLKSIIRDESEQEKLARQILKRLNAYSDYSAEFAQISSVLGTTNRTVIAQEMAQKYCDNYSTKIIMDNLVNPNNGQNGSVENVFTDAFGKNPDPWGAGASAAGGGSGGAGGVGTKASGN